ncbi:transposase [Flavobacterium sp. ACN6]|uniref:transposase n=1 Tax=Flavobacterium sp. ACN6 TaxID=1920426 RepID=UPI000BB3974B|nr:transposase [Flavobacterium sp. ACN6]PBJ15811.1 Transposase IS200 like protein [Flavobacterium sp. ACN6]
MTLYKEKFKTDSNRLRNWDYSSEAVYFITIVTKNRECLFGTIAEGKMILNENGKIIETELLKSIKIRKNWFFHNWIIMPNHIHLLVEIQSTNVSTVETHSSTSTPSISTTECDKSESETNSEFLPEAYIVKTHSSVSTSSTSTKEFDKSLSTNVAETHCCAPLQNQSESKFFRKSNSISSFVTIFKSVTTKEITSSESIWQANFHDHIVRNYKTFDKIYSYIKNNPRSWETDSLK